MNRIHLLLLCSFCLPAVAEVRQSREWASSEAVRLQNMRITEVTTNAFTVGREEELLQELRKRKAIILLLRLRDRKTTEDVLKEFKGARGKCSGRRIALAKSCAPWLLDDLAPLLYEEDTFYKREWNEGGDGHSDFGYSMSVAQIMTRIIASSPEMPAEVRGSAGALRGVDENSLHVGLLDMMRQWWKVNESALREERYAEVTPPAFVRPKATSGVQDSPAPLDEASREGESLEETNPLPPTKAVVAPLGGPSAMTSEDVISSPDGESRTSLRWMIVCGVAIVGIGIAAACIAVKRRAQQVH
jgi:hypothetical protein